MVNKEQRVLNAIEKNNELSITNLVKELRNMKRCQIRISIAYLLGAGLIKEKRIGMAKVYYSKTEDKKRG